MEFNKTNITDSINECDATKETLEVSNMSKKSECVADSEGRNVAKKAPEITENVSVKDTFKHNDSVFCEDLHKKFDDKTQVSDISFVDHLSTTETSKEIDAKQEDTHLPNSILEKLNDTVDTTEIINRLLPSRLLDSMRNAFTLDDNQIVQSVREASAFFNMADPEIIAEGWATGVMTKSPCNPFDDILIFNREQLLSMGIDDKMGLDLVMTHETAHRALDGKVPEFNSHQEELCCDFMAGVRAGLNNIDESKLEHSLGKTKESLTHPWGVERVIAVEKGLAYAKSYMLQHNNVAPSFEECLEEFKSSNLCQKAAGEESPNEFHGISDKNWLERQIRITGGTEQLHWAEELAWVQKHHGLVSEGETKDYISLFDAEHPMPSFEQLKNAGFSNHIANQILYGDNHCYSQAELFDVLNSDNPLESYNKMMDSKVNDALEKASELEKEIEEKYGITADEIVDDKSQFDDFHGMFGNGKGDYILDDFPYNRFKGCFINDAAWHYKYAGQQAENASYYRKEAIRAAERGDFSRSKDCSSLANSYAKKAKSESDLAKTCTK